ncbi:MAG: hypothetical protein ACJAWS_003334, partial [Oleiphilaceae bacterium]
QLLVIIRIGLSFSSLVSILAALDKLNSRAENNSRIVSDLIIDIYLNFNPCRKNGRYLNFGLVRIIGECINCVELG